MRLLLGIFLLHTLQIVFVSTTADKASENKNNYVFPPENSFCLFTSGVFVFEDKMKEVAAFAKLEGAGTIQNINAHLPKTAACEKKQLWGAVYYIKNDDKEKVVEYAYEERLTIADVTIVRPDRGELIDCVTMDAGLLPQAYPVRVYTEFPRDICLKDYLDRLTKIGVPQDYTSWLSTLPADKKDSPRPAYVREPASYSPPTQGCPPPINLGIGPQITEYDIPEGKMCVFVDGDLIFEDAMTKLIPSATLIGPAMLWDIYVGLGCPTRPDKLFKYKGFDNAWGVAYTIEKKDFDKFVKAGEEYLFTADVHTILNELQQTDCKTFDVGLLPSGYPFQVFKASKSDVDTYTKRLKEVGVPTGYIDAVEALNIKLKTYQELAKNPTVYTVLDTTNR